MITTSQHSSKNKKAYIQPRLVRHGDVRQLTQAGTKGCTETAPGCTQGAKKP